MKIDQLQEKLENLKYSTVIKNGNELYVSVPKSEAAEVATLLYSAHKLNFAAEYCQQETGAEGFLVSILFISRKHNYYVVIRYKTDSSVMSIQNLVFQAHLFEREMADLYGLEIEGGADRRHLVKHEPWEKDVFPLRKDFPHGVKVRETSETGIYEYKGLAGEGGYQIAVGPVHAGIIEPGHFRFSAIGESIENLELRLMYKHRGIEKLMENVDADKLGMVFERVSGESTAAYAEGYAHLVESLVGWSAPDDLKALRVVLLELERACNFLEDIAGICVDIGFSYPAKKYSYFSEIVRQLCERVTGSRFLRNSIIPCGSGIEFSSAKAVDIVDTLESFCGRFNRIVGMTLSSVSFLDRVENTGIIRNDNAVKLCMTGVSGRASGIVYDVRNSFGYELYPKLKKPVLTESIGGVFERYKLKVEEVRNAFDYIRGALECIGGRTVPKQRNPFTLMQGQEAIVSVETVKGDLIIYGMAGRGNRFERIYMKTPSFANWRGLTYAVMGEIVPDFPLCNKSLNMSYSENDR